MLQKHSSLIDASKLMFVTNVKMSRTSSIASSRLEEEKSMQKFRMDAKKFKIAKVHFIGSKEPFAPVSDLEAIIY